MPLAQEKSADKKVCHQGKPSADNDSFEKKKVLSGQKVVDFRGGKEKKGK